MGTTSQKEGSGHTEHLRRTLQAAREDRGLSTQAVADLIAANTDKDSLSGETVRAWEKMIRNPPIDQFAAWARALGYQLMVDLSHAKDDRIPVLLRNPEAIEVARRMELASEEDRKTILNLARRLIVG